MIDYIKRNFLSIIIIIALLVIVIQRQSGYTPGKPEITVHKDTSYVVIDSTIHYRPLPYKVIEPSPTLFEPIYLPDTNYERLRKQYLDITSKYLAEKQYRDSIKVDSLGEVYINDTVSKNEIQGRDISYNFKIPTYKETITIKEPYNPKRQVYIGGGVALNQTQLINQFEAGLLYKDRRDRIFEGTINLSPNAGIGVGVRTFWKIKLGKK